MPNGKPIRILFADDHPIFRDGLRYLLKTQLDFRVVGEASDGPQSVTLAQRLKPDILLLDIAMPTADDGLEVLRQLSRESLSVRTIVLTGGIEEAQMAEALRLGARGIVLKGGPSDFLLKSIRTVVAGQIWVGHKSVADLLASVGGAGLLDSTEEKFGLSAREREIVSEILGGCTNKEIAGKLSISTETVKRHLSTIYHKVGVSNRLELALFAATHKLGRRSSPPEPGPSLRLITTKVAG